VTGVLDDKKTEEIALHRKALLAISEMERNDKAYGRLQPQQQQQRPQQTQQRPSPPQTHVEPAAASRPPTR
jgi:hypothetical protein